MKQWYAVRCSYGNDSIAMIQYLHECGLKNVMVFYSNTEWASDDWPDRVRRGEEWVKSLGFIPITIGSIGMEQLVKTKTKAGMWPTRLAKFCTKKLKILPFLNFINAIDPHKRMLVCVGVRRSESIARSKHPAFMPEKDDGRHVWHPIIDFSEEDRNAMVAKTPIELFDGRSRECAICINANRADLRKASENEIRRVEILEQQIGRPMFSPKKFMGAVGIREVRRWADSDRGQYKPSSSDDLEQILDNEPADCEDNWCGL